jgi:hypothetical protein
MNKRGRKPKFIGIDREINSLYVKKGLSKLCGFDMFQQWYLINHKNCHYCGLSKEETIILFNKYPESTRGGRRGKKLELDKKIPKLEYWESLENLCFSCYWCNNAKTNYFTEDEFKSIGKLIGDLNRKRIYNKN